MCPFYVITGTSPQGILGSVNRLKQSTHTHIQMCVLCSGTAEDSPVGRISLFTVTDWTYCPVITLTQPSCLYMKRMHNSPAFSISVSPCTAGHRFHQSHHSNVICYPAARCQATANRWATGVLWFEPPGQWGEPFPWDVPLWSESTADLAGWQTHFPSYSSCCVPTPPHPISPSFHYRRHNQNAGQWPAGCHAGKFSKRTKTDASCS